MTYKWIGAMLVLFSCGGAGFSMAAGYRQRERFLHQLLHAIQLMQWELQYRLTALPDLCRMAGKASSGALRDVFYNLARELDWRSAPDAGGCMAEALKKSREISKSGRRLLHQLGNCLGRFDLPGQLQGLDAVKDACQLELKHLEKDRDNRIRSYQTLGLCAGAALAVLFV